MLSEIIWQSISIMSINYSVSQKSGPLQLMSSSSFLACNSKIAYRHTSTSSSTEGSSEPNLLRQEA